MKTSPERFSHLRLSLLVLFASMTLVLFLVGAAEDDTPKKTWFLPKSPTAAAYVLNRLSNKELMEAPRSEFVFVALLQRAGLERKHRFEALDGLAKARGTDPLTELIGGISELDKKGEESEPVLRELGGLLLQNKSADLIAKRALLEKLATEAQMPVSRQLGFAAMVTANGSIEKVWAQVEADASKLADLLLAVPLLRDANLRATLYPKIQPLLQKSDPAEVRRAAITAIAAVPGRDAETFNTLAGFVKSGTERAAAVVSLQRIPRKSWPKDQAEALIESLIAYLKTVPPDQRTEADAMNAFQFATDLNALLPPEKASGIGKSLRSMGVSVFVVRTILEQMLYDKTLLVVEAGKPVEIILVNDDSMPHNLVITLPGAVEEIGNVAEKMPLEPDAQGRLYVPASPKILYATKMVDVGQRAKLAFTAPSEPGDYQYVCTFPGHWRRMLGTLAVVPDVEAYLSSHATTEPKFTEWKVEDLAPDLMKAGATRNLASGKDFFTKLACAQCHKLGAEGNNFGPELTDVFARHKNDRAEVLRQILEPSLVIVDRYRNFEFELKNGDTVTGMIVKEDAEVVTAQSGASDALIQVLKKSDIKSRQPQASSLMPLGLLNSLSKEQILDLLAYIEAGGKIPAHEHAH
ncbi:MAG: c-type cytochrome [Verrucomicrobia bacterium]|nr:c-type cytochrome [Verrucomicrobiota bacterium]